MTEVGSLVAPEVAGGPNGRTPGKGPHPLRRRRGLPGGRAVTGGLLVAAAAVGLFAAYARVGAGPRRSFVVTRHAMAAGSRVQASDLTLAALDLPPSLRARAFPRVAQLVGTTLVAPLGQGELVQASSVVAARPGGAARVVSFPVERGRLGALKQGEKVDVLATYGTGADAYTAVVLRQALVTDVDRGKSSLGDTGSAVVSVAVDDPADELAMAHALQLGKLTVVVATGSPAGQGVPGTYRSGPAPGTADNRSGTP
jgi:hypothetical protein